MRHLVLCLILSALASAPLRAQVQTSAGISARRLGGEHEPWATTVGTTRVAVPDAATRGGRRKWIAGGAVLGGVVGGALAARRVARTDDAFFGGPAIGLGVVVGVLGGGLIGALAHATLHPVSSAMSPNNR